MRVSKIFKREDKSQVRITVDFWADHRDHGWRVMVETKAPRKRKWFDAVNTNDFQYRKLSMGERSTYRDQKHLELVTEEEITSLKMMLIDELKSEVLAEK